ncbi:hypothetical protein KFL_001610170 [Klebsormidium nitens]|uniref:Glycosyltransferase 2-like domain-containing protein n=1 Tax=Klebsormidium nitens TaxID=105231 RepID=A0A1Y1I4Z6_KLENI|nr:hypothetical protein KFL_001610170 [Klebsormidium nitens]|eukprot:GAQ83776.1 hypothetical protein KFL_001610170 [Klebsormidium nitens]
MAATTMKTLAALVPVTSRPFGSRGRDVCVSRMECLARSLERSGPGFGVICFLGIDEGDPVYDGNEEGNSLNEIMFLYEEHGLRVRAHIKTREPGQICDIWRDLAALAYRDVSCDYYVLLGDDVHILTAGWMSNVEEAYGDFEKRLGVYGFGCVALNDISFPGFPTFPIMHRTHMDAFGGVNIVPDAFTNQDGDPWLFEIYKRWRCARILEDVVLENAVGGQSAPRYARHPVLNWKNKELHEGVKLLDGYLDRKCGSEKASAAHLLLLDVVVPTFRCDVSLLNGIRSLRIPEGVATTFIFIIDDPAKKEQIERIKEWESAARPLGSVRVRVNDTNAGASTSRNHGLSESSADWVLFLDDDVIPDADLLQHFADAIRARGHETDGFVGMVEMPRPVNRFTRAVGISHLTYWYDVSRKMERVSWGTTANLAVRRSALRFGDGFPKTGGGEDVDFCLRLLRWPLVPVPGAVARHPWWRNGARDYSPFSGWARGDGRMVILHPRFAYRRCPNLVEVLGAVLLVAAAWAAANGLPTVLLPVLTMMLALCAAELGVEVYRCFWGADRNHMPGIRGITRLEAAAEAALLRNWSEAGDCSATCGVGGSGMFAVPSSGSVA